MNKMLCRKREIDRSLKFLSLRVFVLLLCLVCTVPGAGETMRSVTYADSKLDNGIILVAFDLQEGVFSIYDSKTNEGLLLDARFGLPLGESPNSVKLLKAEDVHDALGIGKRLVLGVEDWNLFRYGSFRASGASPARALFSYTLHENNPALVLGFGLKTHHYISMRLMKSEPLAGGQLFGGGRMDHPLTLNGSAGAEPTLVKPGLSRISANSLMLTALVNGQRRTAVWGGLGYSEFGKIATLQDGSPGFFAEDPVGRLVDEGQTYLPADSFYLDVHTREPFDALERYGLAM